MRHRKQKLDQRGPGYQPNDRACLSSSSSRSGTREKKRWTLPHHTTLRDKCEQNDQHSTSHVQLRPNILWSRGHGRVSIHSSCSFFLPCRDQCGGTRTQPGMLSSIGLIEHAPDDDDETRVKPDPSSRNDRSHARKLQPVITAHVQDLGRFHRTLNPSGSSRYFQGHSHWTDWRLGGKIQMSSIT